MPSNSNIFVYCFTSAFLGSTRILRSDSSSSSSSATPTGSRPTSSGIRPKRCRSSGLDVSQQLLTVRSVFLAGEADPSLADPRLYDLLKTVESTAAHK